MVIKNQIQFGSVFVKSKRCITFSTVNGSNHRLTWWKCLLKSLLEMSYEAVLFLSSSLLQVGTEYRALSCVCRCLDLLIVPASAFLPACCPHQWKDCPHNPTVPVTPNDPYTNRQSWSGHYWISQSDSRIFCFWIHYCSSLFPSSNIFLFSLLWPGVHPRGKRSLMI